MTPKRSVKVASAWLLAASAAILGAGELSGQCADSTDWVYGYAGASRLNGNAVRLYSDTALTGNHRYWWISYIQTWFYFNQTLAGSQPLATSGVYGGTSWQSYTPTLESYGPGTYAITGFHAAYTPYCDIWEPPYSNGWSGYTSDSMSVSRPGRPDYAPGYPRALWYLGTQILSDGQYPAQTTFTPGAANGAPETPTYVIAAGDDKLKLSCWTCNNPIATATGASGGCQMYDVVVKTSYNGFLSEPFWLFINRPWNLAADGAWVRSVDEYNGYRTFISYTTSSLCSSAS